MYNSGVLYFVYNLYKNLIYDNKINKLHIFFLMSHFALYFIYIRGWEALWVWGSEGSMLLPFQDIFIISALSSWLLNLLQYLSISINPSHLLYTLLHHNFFLSTKTSCSSLFLVSFCPLERTQAPSNLHRQALGLLFQQVNRWVRRKDGKKITKS